ncbi:Inactive LRR receptor-like serine/threonine-protein kinase BIR2 [Zea mays]|uniref:MLO-like protein n=1 Tax=Zea mays TaxID=4577 RepID=A0A1D6I912_MAIZE|nr:Inactive LRR receptor-like serine/threonine-protein kinase BIR2 [Zea mays]
MAATHDFSTSHIVVAGSSRAGTAYRAVLRDGSALTVKRLHSCPLSEKAFRAEMGRMGQLRHPNIVPLLGFCVVEDERLLVYKHMESGALSSVMKKPGEAPLDWATRLRTPVGAARGLAWLHHWFQVPQIHQNLSSSAVLLDEDYDARITDVGLTRLVRMAPGEGGDTSPFLNGDFGEFGYVAPEYASNPVGTMKGDAYAFGVILFELVSGQEAAAVVTDVTGEGFKGTLVDWVNQLKASGRISDAIDKPLRGKGHEAEIQEFLKIAFACTQPQVILLENVELTLEAFDYMQLPFTLKDVQREMKNVEKDIRVATKRNDMLSAKKPCLHAELMLLGVISLLLSQTTLFISEICVPSSLFTSRFYICSESDYQDLLRNTDANQTALDKNMFGGQRLHVCGEGHEPFVSYEGLEQLHRFLFILGITHVLYNFVTVVLSMIKVRAHCLIAALTFFPLIFF